MRSSDVQREIDRMIENKMDKEVTVYIVVYRGTIYGVFSNREKAEKYYDEKFAMDADILERKVL